MQTGDWWSVCKACRRGGSSDHNPNEEINEKTRAGHSGWVTVLLPTHQHSNANSSCLAGSLNNLENSVLTAILEVFNNLFQISDLSPTRSHEK